MSGRSHLSIGDVLSLLREEFPDVTISKIRFLESQGLVDPERSPSGYRKFYEHDVARLRWVLRKQRDQFLPLKVIRDRLAAAGTGVPPDDEPNGSYSPSADAADTPGAGAPGYETPASEGAATGPPEEVEDARGLLRVVQGTAEVHQGPNGAAGWETARAQGAHVAAAGGATGAGDGDVGGDPHGPPPAVPVSAAPAVPVVAQAAGTGARSAPEHPGTPRDAVTPGSAAGGDTAVSTGGVPEGGHDAGHSDAAPASEMLSASVTGVSLNLSELCAASGLTSQTVTSLQALGLMSSMAIAGDTFYDEEALTVAKLVAEFGRYGIEPRHLKMYRNAADREVGLVEQVVTPLLRQRNPEARQRAVDAAAELARLGQHLRAALVRRELRRLLGP